MLLQEFEQRTGIYPPDELYTAIEAKYNASNMDKDEFCRMYRDNVDGFAEVIQREVTLEEVKRESRHTEQIRELEAKIESLQKKIESLEEQLEKAQGWKPMEVSKMSQRDYEKLKANGEIWNEDKAKDWIEDEFGFRYDRIIIYTAIPLYEKSNDGHMRENGKVDRPPVYNATDYNYIRFDVEGWQYEAVNGQLYQYYD